MRRDYPKKFSVGLRKKFAEGGAVEDADTDSSPRRDTGDPDVDRASQNFDSSLRKMGVTPPRATSTTEFNEDFARHALGMSEAEITRRKAGGGRGYAKGGPVKKK